MQWPADHPARTDPALACRRDDADPLEPQGHVVVVLRHVPGRRVTSLIRTPGEQVVLKLFASPRARGNDRRLRALRRGTGSLVPRPLGVGPAGHAGLLEFVPGKPLRELSGQAFVAACEQVGLALARLQASDAELDRVWTAQDEIDHLQRHRGSHGRCWRSPGGRSVVPAHRDLHLAQVVVAAGAVRLIDLDDATMAPAGLDVGNFLAHLDQEGAVGNRPGDEVAAAAAAFLRGHGSEPRDLPWWREIALTRLAVLADERHGRPDWAESLRALVR